MLACQRSAYDCAPEALRSLLAQPLPSVFERLALTPMLSVDIETTSLDVSEGHIVSIAWVPVDDERIVLARARHIAVRVQGEVGQSAIFHQITDTDMRSGSELSSALEQFAAVATGRVLVFHNATLDMAFLGHAIMEQFGLPLLMPVIDTMAVERRRLLRQNQTIQEGRLRLYACRRDYGLPDYPPHNALSDALATAELLLAQMVTHGVKSTRIRDFS